LNTDLEYKIKNISETVQSQIITHSTSGWWLWKHDEEHVENIEIRNPNKEIDESYYHNVILARNERIKSMVEGEDKKKAAQKELQEELKDQKGAYTKSIKTLENTEKLMNVKINHTQEQIDLYVEKIKEIDQTEKNVTAMIGLSGKPLIDCLIAVRKFAQTLKPGAIIYSPLVAILSAIQDIVKENIALLGG